MEKFNVAVVATMSSGKSTTLNAMLGIPLLPSMNEACTATIYKIEDVDGLVDFQARYITHDNNESDWENITTKDNKLIEWNNSGFQFIEIRGDFPHIDNHKSIISFIDTPGPNNSSDKSHSDITHDIISTSKFGFILCIMNASQFGVDDERILLENLLEDLKKKGTKTKIVFAVNKIDQLDMETEKPHELIKKIKRYLTNIGYFRPTVVPIMSLLSLEIREVIEAHKNKAELTFSSRKQKQILRNIEYLSEFSEEYRAASINSPSQKKYLDNAINQARHLNKSETVILANNDVSIGKLIEADIVTGIPLLEEMLEIELLKHNSGNTKVATGTKKLKKLKKPKVKRKKRLKPTRNKKNKKKNK
ncbi:dynamin family protein [Colwellia sp. BRX8-9]|uniref:dynamin family protein n=1 Tax=Colwellia sp. BRX8-9 TaxID=2759831 RepID=UPI0015F44686|nr:dynamin family protein [Colwellia sp. BRX8-9]MBA6350079.1 dynamin family protein [Colwellia sp. BRX8-9]